MNDPGLQTESTEVPDLLLERYLLNELEPDDAAQVARRLEADATLAARLAALRQSDEEWRSAGDSRWLTDGLRSRGRSGSRPAGVRILRWAIPIGAAAALGIWAVAPTAITTAPPLPGMAADSGDRIKGLGASLAIYRRTDSGSEQLDDGAPAREGDVLRIGYRVAKRGYGAIVSIDGRGHVTIHHPASGTRAVSLDTGGQVLLDRAFELDDAPDAERFHFIAGAAPFDLGPVVDAVRSAGAAGTTLPGLDPALDHSTLVLRKDARP